MAAIPSPLSTGHAGPAYELHLGAACLAVLLTGGMVPLFSDKALKKVHLQTRHLGWTTDDLLLVGESVDGIEHHVAIQAKRTFVMRSSDEECLKTFHAAWDDFHRKSPFSEDRDRIALVTGEAPTSFSRGMRAILDAARASLDAADFEARASKCFSKEAKDVHLILCRILRDHAGANATDEAIWGFLRVWDFAVLDLHAPSGIAEALIISLLAGTGPLVQATETWHSLLVLVTKDASRAQSFDWNSLPAELRERHQMPTSAQKETFEVLRDISKIVRDGIEDCLTRNHEAALPRPQIVAEGLATLEQMDALLVTGPAGSGKSVIAAKIHDVLAHDALALSFRADTLATPHLATSALNVGLSLRPLVRLFALHQRKLLWIESAERLFEKTQPEREAFMDLLRLLVREGGWKLLITCRDYSAELFRSAFLDGVKLKTSVLTVPELTDDECETVAAVLPQLCVPLLEPSLRKVLRNPFHLNLAARMAWPESTCSAMSRRAFRDKAWQEVVCRIDEPANGMPLNRGSAMIEVALRRARALVPYVSVDEISPAAIHALERDSLLASNPVDRSQFTPSHDVYEDWALSQYVRRLRERFGGVNADFLTQIGNHPAMRRAFRLLLLELLDAGDAEGEQLVLSMMNDATLGGFWRDEALVAVFQCEGAAEVLPRLAPAFLSDDGALLRRSVHLLRVSCRKLPAGIRAPGSAATLLLLPDGTAWDVMPTIILQATSSLQTLDILWLLGFLEDWSKGITTDSSPKGAKAVASLCELLLLCVEHISYRHQQTFRERVFNVMLTIPGATGQKLQALVNSELSEEHHNFRSRSIVKLIWSHFTGAIVCREAPELTMTVVESRLRLPEKNQSYSKSGRRRTGSRKIQAVFGLGHLPDLDDFPASAWQGPFLNLLTYHSERGVDLILNLTNHCCSEYSSSADEFLESPVEVDITLEDGSLIRQWASRRLWQLYRGSSVGPDVLQSALMALEAWLLQKGERGDSDLRDVISQLLRHSNNVAITSVLVSVALAYPYLLAESAVPLLTSPSFFDADLIRSTTDQADSRSSIAAMFPETDGEKVFLEGERRESAKKPHRRQNIESLAVMLQMTPARPQVWALIDRYVAELPPEADQNNNDRVWRLRLHRIDVRNFVKGVETDEGKIIYHAGPASPDLEDFKQRDLPAHQDMESRTWLYLWGVNVFEWREPEKFRPIDWREKLNTARSLPPNSGANLPRLLLNSGVPQIAAVCLRDHWPELNDEDRSWCVNTVCSELESLSEPGDFAAGMMGAGEGVNTAAQVASLILARSGDPVVQKRVMSCLKAALLHPKRHIAQSAANGIGVAFHEMDQTWVLAGVHVMLRWARETAEFEAEQKRLPWNERHRQEEFDQELRNRLCSDWEQASFDESMFYAADFLRFPGLLVLHPILGFFGRAYENPLAQRIHIHLAKVLLDAWRSDQRKHRGYPRDEDDNKVELRFRERHHLTDALARFALSCPLQTSRAIADVLASGVPAYQENCADFVKQLAYCEDLCPSSGRFWLIWQIFADTVITSTENEADTSKLSKLVDALFLGISWKPATSEWNSLVGEGVRVLQFFHRLPTSHTTLTSFSILAARFKSELIPVSLPILAEKLATLPDHTFISQAAIDSVETILESLVYTGASEIRCKTNLRTATLALLDMLVEAGSSTAFKLRDDFLTPLRN